MIKCNHCSLNKEEKEFNFQDKRFSKLGWCKKCFKEYDSQWYKIEVGKILKIKFEYYPDYPCKCKCGNIVHLKVSKAHKTQGIPDYIAQHYCKTEEFKQLQRNRMKGTGNPMYGTVCYWRGKKRPEHSIKMRGKNNPMSGRTKAVDPLRSLHISESLTVSNKNKGENNGMFGKHHREESIEKIRKKAIGRPSWRKGKSTFPPLDLNQFVYCECGCGNKVTLLPQHRYTGIPRFIKGHESRGMNNGNWQGGKSFEKYPKEFKDQILAIRNRDNHICKICKLDEEQVGHTLSVHHIDYNKKNCDPMNLMSLCKSCHTTTNHNREYWQSVLSQLNKSYIEGISKCL